MSKWTRSKDHRAPWGRPCPWCDELIENEWTEHSFVAKDGVMRRPGPRNGEPTALPDGLYGDCPHCGKEFTLQAGTKEELAYVEDAPDAP